ncbi:MAG: Gfo/Idh/MocA family protein [Candidatus Sumerlaeia bacterium]
MAENVANGANGKKVRLAVIGIGNMGGSHAAALRDGKIARCELAAVCDINPEKMKGFDGVPQYEKSEELIRAGVAEAVLLATPHYAHTTIGIDALENGLHVLVEKPVSVHKADAERLIAAYRKTSGRVFAAMFNQRTNPSFIKLRELIQSGELGELRRVNWIITDWFRTQGYYASSDWRATWKGEGGGVLMNQAQHNLDLLQWMCGMPKSVHAFCPIAKYHNIEVEDEVTASLMFENGASGVFVTSTGEAPGINRLEVYGDKGKVIVEGNTKLTWWKTQGSIREYSDSAPTWYNSPEMEEEVIAADGIGGQHHEILHNFTDAILDGADLIAPAEEGINAVELTNAMQYSGHTGQTVKLPLDSAVYARKLQDLIANSTFVKETIDVTREGYEKPPYLV